MTHILYDVPMCQQRISELAQFEDQKTVNHGAVGLTPTCRDFTPL